MTKTIEPAGYVMFDTQKTAIFGLGSTVDEAWANTQSNTDRPVNAYTDEPVNDDEWFAQFTVSGASQALLDLVNEMGGDIAWQSVGGVACTEAEYDEARVTQMTVVTKEAFDAFVLEHCPMHVRDEPRVENDNPYKYECYDNEAGEEVAFITWKDAKATYTIKDAE